MNAEVNRSIAPWQSGLVSLFDMLKRYAFSFYEVISSIEKMRCEAGALARASTYSGPEKVPDYKRTALIETLAIMRSECNKIDATASIDLVSHIESEVRLKVTDYFYADMVNHLDALSALFAGELRRKACFRIAEDKEKYFQKDDLFGLKVSKAFKSCVGEIQAAGNCFALEQWEASAFHSLRILECGLRSLAKRFEVDFTYTNWQTVLNQVGLKIREMNSDFGADWKEQQKFYSQAATHFRFFKDAWRNPFMHGRDTPFDEGRALSAFNQVREFMRALADGGLKEANEDGDD